MFRSLRPGITILMVIGLVLLSGCGLARRAGARQTQAAATPILSVDASTASPLPQPTDTAAATQTTAPAATPTVQVTQLAEPSTTPMPSPPPRVALTPTPASVARLVPTSTARSATVVPAGTIQVDNWSLTFAGAASDPGKNPALQQPDPTNQTLVVFLTVTNMGSQTATFTAFAKIQIMDEQGHVFANDNQADAAARQKYGTDFGSSIAPGATQRLAMAYEVPALERQFTIIQGNPAGPWTGNFRFILS